MNVHSGPAGYSRAQIVLHWTIALLILVQFLAADGIENAWNALQEGDALRAGDLPLAWLHVGIGITVLVLAFVRVWLRLTRGAPPLPDNDPLPARIGAHVVHALIYLLLFLMPISGSIAWFGGVGEAGDVHEFLKTALLVLICLHVAGALVQQFVLRSGIMMRMLRPAS